ncbi:MAG TPA: DUF4406 domain-containing protein [Tepidimicrobium sp.]|nr:DUF4406 domain-containing protein [Tepidimicrobium sp.]
MDLQGKYAFISHPYSQSPEKNKKRVEKACKYWIKKGVVPISPLHLFSFYSNDNQRDKIMEYCYRMICSVDIVFVYGTSEGCRLEEEFARKIGKPVYTYYKKKRKPNYVECKYLMRENKGVHM